MEVLTTTRSQEMFERAKRFLPGGVTGDGRFSEPYPLIFTRAKGKWLTDVDGNDYLDYHGGFGTAILGYSHPEVDDAVQRSIKDAGVFVGVPHQYEGELAERLTKLIPCADRVALCGGGGSDAIYHAIRAARAATGRTKIVKVEGGYQGWHADVGVSTKPELDTSAYVGRPDGISNSLGSLPAVVEEVLVVSAGDESALEETFAEFGANIAAFIVEPALYSFGCVTLDPEYLELARELCSRHGSVLIFDEIMSGFRNGLGGAGARAGIVPDLAAFGKALANGYIISALAGRDELMGLLTPEGRVFYSGTFNGHPPSVAAAMATLDILERDAVPQRLWVLGDRLATGINNAAEKLKTAAVCQTYGSVWNLYLGTTAVRNYRDYFAADLKAGKRLNGAYLAHLRENGLYLHRRHVNRGFISSQHDDEDIDRTIDIVADFLEAHQQDLA